MTQNPAENVEEDREGTLLDLLKAYAARFTRWAAKQKARSDELNASASLRLIGG